MSCVETHRRWNDLAKHQRFLFDFAPLPIAFAMTGDAGVGDPALGGHPGVDFS